MYKGEVIIIQTRESLLHIQTIWVVLFLMRYWTRVYTLYLFFHTLILIFCYQPPHIILQMSDDEESVVLV